MAEDNPVIQAAKEYTRDSETYKSMKELGRVLGLSSHVVGKSLKKIGLRDPEGKPTQIAKVGGYVKTVQMIEGFYFDVWHEQKTLRVLRPLFEQPTTPHCP
jgi:hypothetical protein